MEFKKKNPWHKKFDFTTGCSSTSRGGEYSGRIETPLGVDWAYDLTWIRELLKLHVHGKRQIQVENFSIWKMSR